MPKIKIDDLNMYYEIHGEGFPLIMISGISVDTYWLDSAVIEGLSKEFKFIIFDHIGIGRSDGTARNLIKTMADDTVGLMNALHIGKAHIFGLSFGGMIAQELILNYPEKVEKLILSGTNCGGYKTVQASDDVNRLMYSFTKADHDINITKKAIPLLFTDDFIKQNPKYVEEKLKAMTQIITSAEDYKNQFEAALKFNTCRRLRQITSPTLILHGRNDILTPPENGEIIANLIPGAELIYFDDAAHWIFAPDVDVIINLIINFLKP